MLEERLRTTQRDDLSGDDSLNTDLSDELFVIRVELSSGEILHPAYIPFPESCGGESSAEAVAYFSRVLAGRGAVKELVLESSLNDAGVRDPSSIVKWSDLKERLNREFLEQLQAQAVSSSVIAAIAENIRSEHNREKFLTLLASSRFTDDEKARILAALDVGTGAHRGVTSARPQDAKGLFHIPYVNHSINVAIQALRLGLSAQAVQAALLHDVIKDSDWTLEKIAARFEPAAAQLVADLTRGPAQPRSDLMAHVATLGGEAQILKALDRFDNLIRFFSIDDKTYIEGVLEEDRSVYNKVFSENPALEPLTEMYSTLHREIARLWGLKP